MTSVSRSTRHSSRLDDDDSKYEEYGGRGMKDDYKSQSAQLRGMKQPILREQVEETSRRTRKSTRRSESPEEEEEEEELPTRGRVKDQVRKIEQRRTRTGRDFDEQDDDEAGDEEEEEEAGWQSKLASTGKNLLHKTEDLSKRLLRNLKEGEQTLESDLKKGIKIIKDDIANLSSQRVKAARAENFQEDDDEEEEDEEEEEEDEEDDSVSRRTRSADNKLNEDEFDLAAEKSDEDRMDWEGGSIHHLRERGSKAIRGFKANIEKAEGFVKQQKNKILKELPASFRRKQVEEEEEEEEEEDFDEDVSDDVEEDLDVDDMPASRSKVGSRFRGGESFLTPQRLIGALAAMWVLFFLINLFSEPIEQTRPAFFDTTNLKGRGSEFAHDIKERAHERMEKIKADTIEFIRKIELGGIQQAPAPPSVFERTGNWFKNTFWPTRISVPQKESSAFQRFKEGLKDGLHRLNSEWSQGDSHAFVPHEADNNMYESPSSFGIDTLSRHRVNRADDSKPILESMGKEGLVKEYLPEDLHEQWEGEHGKFQQGSNPSFWSRLNSWFSGTSSSTPQQKPRGGVWDRFQNNLRHREGIRTGERSNSIHHQALKYGDKASEAIFSEPRHVEMRVGPDLSQTHIINPRQQTIHSGDQESHSLQDDIRAKLQSRQPLTGRSRTAETDSSNPSIIDRAQDALREGVETVRSHLPHMPDLGDVTSRPVIPGLHRAGEMLRNSDGLNSPTANMHMRDTLHNGEQRLREGADRIKTGFQDRVGDAREGLHNIERKLQDGWESVKDGASDVKNRVQQGFNDAKEYVEDATRNLRRDGEYAGRRGLHNLGKGGHRVEEGFNEAKHRTQEFVEQGKHRVGEKLDDLKDKVNYHMP